ncbi:hypothetical protein [Gordonia sp. NPDC003376]
MTDNAALLARGTRPWSASWAWLTRGLVRTAVILALSVVSWWLLVDPTTNIVGWNVYPEPFTSWLFWCLIIMVALGFNLEFHHFEGLRQPLRGIVLVTVSAAGAALVTFLLSAWLGDMAPSFAGSREGGAGYAAASNWVLYAFLFYVMSVVNWNHWPWTDERITQPWKGVAEIVALFFPTTVVYALFSLPNLLLDGTNPILSMDVSVGYFYSCILSVVLTGNLTDNWPWRLAGSPARVALASVVGNLVLGAVLFFALRGLVPVVIGADNAAAIGTATASMPAQLGVCWVMWAILWPNAFDNHPTVGRPLHVQYSARLIITFVLAVVTFVLYYFVVAGPVLHEPRTGVNMAGNALGFIDLCILWALWYLLCFNSWGLRSQDSGAAVAVDQEQTVDSVRVTPT